MGLRDIKVGKISQTILLIDNDDKLFIVLKRNEIK